MRREDLDQEVELLGQLEHENIIRPAHTLATSFREGAALGALALA